MSRKISSVVKQLVVFEKLLSRVVRFHALRTNKALKDRSANIRHIPNRPANNERETESKMNHTPMKIDVYYLRCLIMV